jgi:hypothetical protein
MYRRVGKAPEWIGLVGQEVGRDQSILIRPDDLAADRAMGAASWPMIYHRGTKDTEGGNFIVDPTQIIFLHR